MEEKVQHALKLIDEDGDSFAKRAEMYYKRRPELINYVEECYRAYRALAGRYDRLSTELQNANTTIASVFPEQVQFVMDDDDDYAAPRIPELPSQVSATNVAKVPNRDLKHLLTSASKKLKAQKSSTTENTNKAVVKSGLSKSEALEEIDKLQKDILVLQTVKEFVKSSYESGLEKFWEIEKQITEKQERVFSLQDEFSMGKEKQERSTKEARAEYKRIEDAQEKLESLKNGFLPDQEKPCNNDESMKAEEKSHFLNQEVGSMTQEREELESLREKIKEHLDAGSKSSLTVTELAEKIDELVNKVFSLETAVSSQTALTDRLKSETDDLQAQIRALEDDKVTLIDGTNNLSNRLGEMETKLHGIQNLNQNVENQSNNLQTHFTEARCSLDHLSKELVSVKPDEELDGLEEEEGSLIEVKSQVVLEKQEDMPNPSRDLKTEVVEDKYEQVVSASVKNQGEEREIKANESRADKVEKHDLSQKVNILLNTKPKEVATVKEDELNWRQMLLNGVEDKEKILLTEYTTILRNYKDVKRELGDVEKKYQDSIFEMLVQLKEQRNAIAKRDRKIQSLRQKLNFPQESFDQSKELKNAPQSLSDLVNDRSAKPETTDLNLNEISSTKNEEYIKLMLIGEPRTISPIEEKLRMNIDAILDENLGFWLRFSSSFHQIQKFKTEVQDLQNEILKLKEKEKTKQEGSTYKRS
ncbi:hypothetical protein F0562_005478 [Nyssa sinensis]|uniref:NAB domain-containing protein n=1 Tax=Nyssa sinensis TaxID=561372 RepID=A0A5J5AKI4_9ASTE|nr:hypothetical protein F0562_005478 [Nyssa sinensis]